MNKPLETKIERGIHGDIAKPIALKTVGLFDHVTLVEGYALPTYIGCHALVALRDTPGKTFSVLTPKHRE